MALMWALPNTIHRAAKLALGALIGLVLALSSSTPASASTWELRPNNQRLCVSSSHGYPLTYFVASVIGTWSTTIETSLENLPPGATSQGSPIGPGSNYTDREDGSTVLNVWVFVEFAPLPVGTYHPRITATDGTKTESFPITIEAKEFC
ncbi:DUF5980 family protein [Nonomuraea diastatica]|uniref:Uncharacterized protein n=1 Tax=Nonomuraea diastatica TaxID=1848329 RepID=A0A4R4WZV4_9ACTN|nr:DUF5980 family protein [Nonomuraea diastatica]TDD23388.1 hypothetical protein E1294_08995 [Nonomuraea diastatica]